MSLDNPHACYWCRQHPCKGGSGNGSCTRREGGQVSWPEAFFGAVCVSWAAFLLWRFVRHLGEM